MPPPPVVEVVAGAVVVPVLPPVVVVAPVVLVVPSPEEPPPAGVVVPLVEFDPAPVLLELEFEPPEVELAPEVVDAEPPDPVFVAVVCVNGVAALVVGTVRDGAPSVSVVPAPLPPQAASASAAITAAPPATMARG
jgi:hypothetical protein